MFIEIQALQSLCYMFIYIRQKIKLLVSCMGISSTLMKSPSPKCYMTFWDMNIHSDVLH